MLLVVLLAALSAGTAAAAHPIAMGVNGHPFSQPNYMVGPHFVARGSAAGVGSSAARRRRERCRSRT